MLITAQYFLTSPNSGGVQLVAVTEPSPPPPSSRCYLLEEGTVLVIWRDVELTEFAYKMRGGGSTQLG